MGTSSRNQMDTSRNNSDDARDANRHTNPSLNDPWRETDDGAASEIRYDCAQYWTATHFLREISYANHSGGGPDLGRCS